MRLRARALYDRRSSVDVCGGVNAASRLASVREQIVPRGRRGASRTRSRAARREDATIRHCKTLVDLIVDYTVPPETWPFLHGTARDLAVSGRRLEKRKEALTLVGVLDE